MSLKLNFSFVADICCGRSLKDVKITVPRAVRVGHSVTLLCEYDLEDAALYSDKWYKNADEFYRFVPKEAPPTRVFPLPGLHVDVSKFNQIILLNCLFYKTSNVL